MRTIDANRVCRVPYRRVVRNHPVDEEDVAVLGHLSVQAEIGRGAFGRVVRAVDRRNGETVAVKFLSRVESTRFNASLARSAL